jgi:peptidoglycan/LPS O-acetylase OafA/YrhL
VPTATLSQDDAEATAASPPLALAPVALPTHLPSLDGIRGIAIALVFVHTVNVLDASSGWLGAAIARVAGFGWIGVELFFVLSGFLITRNLMALQSSPDYYRVFWGRRVLRIFPLYYATLFLFFIVWPQVGTPTPQYAADLPNQWTLWLFLSNWTQGRGWGVSLPHFWSLAVEEQFYLLWPFVVRCASPRQIIAVCAAVVLAAVASRVALLWHGIDPMQIYTFTVTRMDALAVGAAVAAWLQLPGRVRKVQSQRLWWVVMAVLVLGVGKLIPKGYGMVDPVGQVIGYSLLAIVFALWITVVACGDTAPQVRRSQQLLRWPLLRKLGKYSFGMYVFASPLKSLVGEPLLARLGWPAHPALWQGVVYLVAMVVVDFALAWLSFHLLEKRFLSLKRFFVPRGNPPVSTGSMR